MSLSFREILEVLSKHDVEFIVVGGVAAVLNGAPISTFDLDALIRISEDNSTRLLRALDELDARYREHVKIVRPTERDVLAGGHLLLMTSAGPLDVLGYVGNDHQFEDLLAGANTFELDGINILVLGLPDLISVKRETGRPKDQAVLAILEEVLSKSKTQE